MNFWAHVLGVIVGAPAGIGIAFLLIYYALDPLGAILTGYGTFERSERIARERRWRKEAKIRQR